MSRLPRDVRDTWLLLGLIGWTVLPHLTRQPLWLAALCAVVLAWRAWLARVQRPLPGRWTLLVLLLIAAGMTWQSQRTLLGRDADRKSTRLNSSHSQQSRMPSSA